MRRLEHSEVAASVTSSERTSLGVPSVLDVSGAKLRIAKLSRLTRRRTSFGTARGQQNEMMHSIAYRIPLKSIRTGDCAHVRLYGIAGGDDCLCADIVNRRKRKPQFDSHLATRGFALFLRLAQIH
jgi:hypothetical protein